MLPGKPLPDPREDVVRWVEIDRISNSVNPVLETGQGPVIVDEGQPKEEYATLETYVVRMTVAGEREK
jgi:hypothetical protein